MMSATYYRLKLAELLIEHIDAAFKVIITDTDDDIDFFSRLVDEFDVDFLLSKDR